MSRALLQQALEALEILCMEAGRHDHLITANAIELGMRAHDGIREALAQQVQPAPERNAITAAAYMQIAEDYRKVEEEMFSGADIATWCELEADAALVQPVQPKEKT